jgi:Fur family ferric uptake transcriptional regulator
MQTAAVMHDQLKSCGLSSTPTRIAILQLLSEGHRIYSIDQIIAILKKSKSVKGSLVFTTVYRCLIKLASVGLIKEVNLGDGVSRYEIQHGEHHHHHVICRGCGAIEPLDLRSDVCGLEKFEKLVKKLGFKDLSHRLEFFGVCNKCSPS